MKFFKKDRFAQLLGIELLEASEGSARAKMEIKEIHLNAMNIVHGAAIFALADLVFEMASNSYGNVAMAINADISFLKAVSEGTLYADATEISKNDKLASYSMRITDEKDDVIAIFNGMVYRKQDMISYE
ncbi:MAG: PaaI family thioesterase [Syntrophobacteraceae bacterium]